jgi:hypothetical protein
MSKVPFSVFNDAIQNQFAVMVASGFPLVSLDINADTIWDTYLNSFPEGTNPIFRERREYDCNCCKNFVRRLGNVVALTPNGYMSIWDVTVAGYYNDVAKAMNAFVSKHSIRDIYVTSEPVAGSKPNKDGSMDITWSHFYVQIPKQFVKGKDEIGPYLSNFRSSFQVFERAMTELKLDAFETVNELITQGSLYRGAEFKKTVADFLKIKKQYDELPDTYGFGRTYFLWNSVKTLGDVVRFRNTAIGTLVTDLSDGVDLEKAVSSFESKVAPQNYKRPTSLVTPSMIAAAQEKIEELGLTSALSRRFATIEDINVKHVLFTSQTVKALNVFDDLIEDAESKVKDQTLAKVEEISLDHFVKNVIPSAKQIEVLFENKHTNNLVSLLTSVDPQAPSLFKWKNNFSWSYNGEVADSLRDRVQALGGRVDGALRFSHSWNHDGQNQSLMDLHVFGPNCQEWLIKRKGSPDEIHESYPVGVRVGWNNRKDNTTGGNQDVDHTSEPGKSIPVENITFPHLNKMPEGKYTFKIHNWRARHPNTSGFKAEIEFDGNIFNYEYNKAVKHHQWITVAEATLKDGKFTIEHKMDNEATSKNVWGIDTNKWVKVNNILLSPNAWDQDTTIGNEHLFFIIDSCKTEDSARGIYNEFLLPDFEPHRKVFELLASKTKAQPTDQQASGLGFSSTRRDKVTVRVTGKTKRTFIVNL